MAVDGAQNGQILSTIWKELPGVTDWVGCGRWGVESREKPKVTAGSTEGVLWQGRTRLQFWPC